MQSANSFPLNSYLQISCRCHVFDYDRFLSLNVRHDWHTWHLRPKMMFLKDFCAKSRHDWIKYAWFAVLERKIRLIWCLSLCHASILFCFVVFYLAPILVRHSKYIVKNYCSLKWQFKTCLMFLVGFLKDIKHKLTISFTCVVIFLTHSIERSFNTSFHKI